jgi:hypothetical protein
MEYGPNHTLGLFETNQQRLFKGKNRDTVPPGSVYRLVWRLAAVELQQIPLHVR